MAVRCRDASDDLLTRLMGATTAGLRHASPPLNVVIRPPYALVGDLTEATIGKWYRDVVTPVARCLAVDYFDRPPDAPITILLLSGSDSYHRCASLLDGRSGMRWYGYYVRAERRIVVNIATGAGTLAHELTHALAHFDCPGLPEWFDEGLAALHEESRFSDDGLHLIGMSNWRLTGLRQARHRGRLRSIASLLTDGIKPESEPLDYAHARFLCLYLQQRGLLRAYYRKLKADLHRDACGLASFYNLPGLGPPERAESDFLRWLDMFGNTL